MWKWITIAGCVASDVVSENDTCVDRILDPLRLVLVIDGSNSVEENAFKNQVRLANSVLSGVRDLYGEAEEGQSVPWQWGAIQFGVEVQVVKDMHVDAGPADAIDESLARICPYNVDPLAAPPEVMNKCLTSYKPSLEKALAMLEGGEGHPFLWFLTDGQSQDIPTPDMMRSFRAASGLDARNITVASVYLTPIFSTITASKAVLQSLSCADPNTPCEDRVLTGDTSTDIAAFSRQATIMFRDVIKRVVRYACVPPLVIATALSAVAIAVIAAVATLTTAGVAGVVVAKKKSHKRRHLAEEEGAMTQAPATGKRSATRVSTKRLPSARRLSTRHLYARQPSTRPSTRRCSKRKSVG